MPASLKTAIQEFNVNDKYYEAAHVTDTFLDAAWQQYILARHGSTKVKNPNDPDDKHIPVNIIGRLASHSWPISSEGNSMHIGTGVHWSINLPVGHHAPAASTETIYFQEATLQAKHWSPLVNDAWILGGVHGGHDFMIVSPLSWYNLWAPWTPYKNTVTAREILGLKTVFKYHIDRTHQRLIWGTPTGNYAVPPKENKSQEYIGLSNYLAAIDNARENGVGKVGSYESIFQSLPRNCTIHATQHLLDENNNIFSFTTQEQVEQMTSTNTKALLEKIAPESVDFRGANLRSAQLQQLQINDHVNTGHFLNFMLADLSGANLSGANLFKADLRLTKLSDPQLGNAIIDANTDLRNTNVIGMQGQWNEIPSTTQSVNQIHTQPGELCLYMRDDFSDNGSTPSESRAYSMSPDLFSVNYSLTVSKTDAFDGENWFQRFNQNPEFETPGYLYLRMQNYGTSVIKKAYAHVYYMDWNTNVNALGDKHKTLVAGAPIPLDFGTYGLAPGKHHVQGPIAWNGPNELSNNGHYCLVCILSDSATLPDFGFGDHNANCYTSESNKVTWHNEVVVNRYEDDGKSRFISVFAASETPMSYQLKVHALNLAATKYIDLEFTSYDSIGHPVQTETIRVHGSETTTLQHRIVLPANDREHQTFGINMNRATSSPLDADGAINIIVSQVIPNKVSGIVDAGLMGSPPAKKRNQLILGSANLRLP